MTSKRPSNRFSGPFLPFPRWLMEYLAGDGTTMMVMLGMLRFMNSNTQDLTVSYDHLAKELGLSRSTVMRSVNKLVELGAVVRYRRSANGRNLTNNFRINFNAPSAFDVPSSVTHDTTTGVSPMTLGSSTHDTPDGVTHDTQTRIKNKNKKTRGEGMNRVDPRLLS
jgi:biotin operon repressor